MSPVTHFFSGWVLANCAQLNRKDRALVTLACVIPDMDGLGIIPEVLTRNSAHPLLWFTLYHHALHNLAFALVVTAVALVLATRRWTTGLLVLLSFHLHLFEDLLGSRGPDGYQWPIPYLEPFSSSLPLVWSGQWGLNAWPNVLLTIGLLFLTLWLARRRGFSPLEMISPKADASLVAALRQRFPAPPFTKGGWARLLNSRTLGNAAAAPKAKEGLLRNSGPIQNRASVFRYEANLSTSGREHHCANHPDSARQISACQIENVVKIKRLRRTYESPFAYVAMARRTPNDDRTKERVENAASLLLS
jgi:hypothetical protein